MSYKLKVNKNDIPLITRALEDDGFVRETKGSSVRGVDNAKYLFVDTAGQTFRYAYSDNEWEKCKYPVRLFHVRAELDLTKPRETILIRGRLYYVDDVEQQLDGFSIEFGEATDDA